MTDAADIRRAVERCGLSGFARRAGCPVPAVQRLVKRGAYPERGPHGEGMRAAVAAVLASAQPAPESLAPPAPESTCTVPERFERTAAFLARESMAAPTRSEAREALAVLAEDCGYTLESVSLVPVPEADEAPDPTMAAMIRALSGP